jgi:hypothetical protein
LISVHFTISEAIHRLTLAYHGIASPIYTCRLHFFILLSHLFLNKSKYFPKFCIWLCYFHLFLISVFNHLSCINFNLQYFVFLQSNNICFTSSSPKHNGHLPLRTFRLTPLSCHIPAINHAILLLSFLEHSLYSFLPKEKFSSVDSR